jgi:hypothetical protein
MGKPNAARLRTLAKPATYGDGVGPLPPGSRPRATVLAVSLQANRHFSHCRGMMAKGIVVHQEIHGALSAAADTDCIGKTRKAPPIGPWGTLGRGKDRAGASESVRNAG